VRAAAPSPRQSTLESPASQTQAAHCSRASKTAYGETSTQQGVLCSSFNLNTTRGCLTCNCGRQASQPVLLLAVTLYICTTTCDNTHSPVVCKHAAVSPEWLHPCRCQAVCPRYAKAPQQQPQPTPPLLLPQQLHICLCCCCGCGCC
jgi:hypothetical protein